MHTNCLQIDWPGWNTSASHAWGGGAAPDIDVWYGGLVDGMRDASGQMYMRNRYYDPATGQFTQTDPIGLAGGLNAYGFAAGDPVSYADPYGLDPCDKTTDKIGLAACKAGQKVKPVAPALNAAAIAITMLPLVEGYGGMAVLGLAGARRANLSAYILGGSIRNVNAVGGTLNKLCKLCHRDGGNISG